MTLRQVTVTDLTAIDGEPSVGADVAYSRHRSDVTVNILGIVKVGLVNVGPARSPINIGIGLCLAATPAVGLGLATIHLGATPLICIIVTGGGWLISQAVWLIANRSAMRSTDRGEGGSAPVWRSASTPQLAQ